MYFGGKVMLQHNKLIKLEFKILQVWVLKIKPGKTYMMVSTFPLEPEIANFNERTSSRFQWINKGSWVNQKKKKEKRQGVKGPKT
jgi:hypothetical protein